MVGGWVDKAKGGGWTGQDRTGRTRKQAPGQAVGHCQAVMVKRDGDAAAATVQRPSLCLGPMHACVRACTKRTSMGVSFSLMLNSSKPV